jgi:alpha-glucosidase
MKFKILLVSVCLVLLKLTCQALPKDYTLTSPNIKLKMQVRVDDSITYSVYLNNNILITPSAIGMTLQSNVLGNDAKVSGTKSKTVNSTLHPLYGKEATLTDNYNELVINFEGNYSLVLRAYNEGVAYRFVTNFNEPIIVVNEKAQFNFSGSPEVVFPETDNYTAWEVPYVSYNSIAAIGEGKKAITPTLFSYPQSKTRVIMCRS